MVKRYSNVGCGYSYYRVDGIHRGKLRIYYATGDRVGRAMARREAVRHESICAVSVSTLEPVGPPAAGSSTGSVTHGAGGSEWQEVGTQTPSADA